MAKNQNARVVNWVESTMPPRSVHRFLRYRYENSIRYSLTPGRRRSTGEFRFSRLLRRTACLQFRDEIFRRLLEKGFRDCTSGQFAIYEGRFRALASPSNIESNIENAGPASDGLSSFSPEFLCFLANFGELLCLGDRSSR